MEHYTAVGISLVAIDDGVFYFLSQYLGFAIATAQLASRSSGGRWIYGAPQCEIPLNTVWNAFSYSGDEVYDGAFVHVVDIIDITYCFYRRFSQKSYF